MTRPRLLDLFCGAGGAAMGYHRASFDVIGVDINPQPHYPFPFIQGDALEYVREHGKEYDAIHASPPCQHYAAVTEWRGNTDDHPDLIPMTQALLEQTGKPYVIENVARAPLHGAFRLCGTLFNLNIRRHRYFECPSLDYQLVEPCRHNGEMAFMHKYERAYADAMGCDWMTTHEAREAIPPAYTEWIGKQLMKVVRP